MGLLEDRRARSGLLADEYGLAHAGLLGQPNRRDIAAMQSRHNIVPDLMNWARQNPVEAGATAVSMSPFEPFATAADVGLSAKDVYDAVQKDDWRGAAISGGLGLASAALPFVGYGAVKAVRGAGKAADLPADPLIAHTNIRPGGLNVADEIGGLPMPSLAISRADHPLTNFGDITLLANKDMAMPSRSTNVWPNDAYTGRQPRGEVDFVDHRSAMKKFANDPKFSHLSDRDYAFHMFDGFEGADRALRTVNAAVEKGLDPKKFASFDDMHREARQVAGYLEDGVGGRGLLDYGETQRLLPQGFTDSGNRKKPKPYTLDNVMREMKRDGAGFAQSEGFNYGPSSFRAAVSPRLGGVADVKKSRGRIVTAAVGKEAIETFDKKYIALVEKVAKASGRDGYQAFDSAAGYMEDLMARRDVSWFEDIPKHLQDDIRDLAKEAAELPTTYFEAKPRRAVGLDEFVGAIVPEKITPETEAILQKHGIDRVFKYGTEEDRIALFKKFPDLMFSVAGAGLLAAPVARGMLADDQQPY